MIDSFAHKNLQHFDEKQDDCKISPDILERIAILLVALDEAKVIEDVDRPISRLHKLKVDLAGYWSTTVRTNWRIVFRFEDGNASNVDFFGLSLERRTPCR
jgi:toxin HigB-1